jgi:hypothetical protein
MTYSLGHALNVVVAKSKGPKANKFPNTNGATLLLGGNILH